MKKITTYAFVLLGLSGCYKVLDEKGFISNDIYLKGADTLLLPIGGRGNTDIAWLDGSSQPATFSIENIRDRSDNRSEQFFKKYLYNSWIKPYNNKTDTTLELLKAKISQREIPCIDINPINGMIQYLETTSNLKEAGDIFKMDVKVENSKGTKVYKDYATIKLISQKQPFIFLQAATAILLVNNAGQTTFTLYDNIPEGTPDRAQNIYDRNGKELIDIYKISEEPLIGIKVLIQYKDAEGVVFDAKDYATYSSGTESYLDYSVNRANTPEGVMVEFPITPFPAKQDLLSYLKGGTTTYKFLDTASMHKGLYTDHQYPFLNPWPEDSWGASKWYIRLRSKIVFNESGTWVISATFPYTHLDGTF